MTPEDEKKLLQSLYDTLFEAICYAPSGKANAFDRETTFIQFSKDEALNPNDFANAMSPLNPKGDMNSAYYFSEMVDQVPNVDILSGSSGKKVSETYKLIVDSANTDNKVPGKQKDTYDAAYKFLNQEVKIPSFQGEPTVSLAPTAIAQTYDDNQASYVNAYSGYRTAELGYDMEKLEDQRKWQTIAPGLRLLVDQTWNKWNKEGKANVEQAQNAMRTTINDAIAAAIVQAQDAMRDDKWKEPSNVGERWMLSYALPSDWTAASGATKFSLRSSYLNTSSSSTSHGYIVGASWGMGLWSVGGESAGSFDSSHYHMDADDVEISAKLATVRIMRPWLNSLLFTMNDWWIKGQGKNAISNGALTGNENAMLPMIPIAFVVASDLAIKANFSQRDEEHIQQSVSAKARVGWGPFSIGGGYNYGHKEDKLVAKYGHGEIRVPGLQIIAWINTITPPSPSMNSPK